MRRYCSPSDFWDYSNQEYDMREIFYVLDELQRENYKLQKSTYYNDSDYYSEEEVRDKLLRLKDNCETEINKLNNSIYEYKCNIAELNSKTASLEKELSAAKQRLKEAGVEDKKQYNTPNRKIIKIKKMSSNY